LAARGDAPVPLRAAARRAAAALTGAPLPRRRLDPATLALPAAADGYLVVDQARLPDLSPLTAIARQLGIKTSDRVLMTLRGPTPDDLYAGQREADLVGELAFELVRRFGNLRLEQTLVAVNAAAPAPDRGPSYSWCAHAVGEFEFEPLAAAVERLVDGVPDVQLQRTADSLRLVAPRGEATLRPDGASASTTGMAGKPRPELARELLAEGPALRVVVPPTSKLWVALAFLHLPPAAGAEL